MGEWGNWIFVSPARSCCETRNCLEITCESCAGFFWTVSDLYGLLKDVSRSSFSHISGAAVKIKENSILNHFVYCLCSEYICFSD